MSRNNQAGKTGGMYENGVDDGKNGRILKSTHPAYWHGWCHGIRLRHWFISLFVKRNP